MSAAGRPVEAKAVWASLDAAISARFGSSLEALAGDLSAGAPSLEELVEREPVCLGGVLLHRGLNARQAGEPAKHFLAGAAASAGHLRAALRAIGSDDGDAEDVAWVAEKELIALACERQEAGIASRIEALLAVGGRRHALAAARVCFVTLVNRGALEDARRIDAMLGPSWRALDVRQPVSHLDASLAYCGAVLELQLPDGRLAEALAGLEALRGALLEAFVQGHPGPASVLYWPATDASALGLRRMGQAGQATMLVRESAARVASIAGFPRPPVA